jgi:D-glycero-alpha-D-manno-heptose-7-phosphate kinase
MRPSVPVSVRFPRLSSHSARSSAHPSANTEVAHLAFEIERIDLGIPGGTQDPYAAAFGGTNFIDFLRDDRVIVNSLPVSDSARNEFESSLVVCFSGCSRDARAIIEQQTGGIAERSTIAAMDRLKVEAVEMKNALLAGNISTMAQTLSRSWKAEQMTALAY